MDKNIVLQYIKEHPGVSSKQIADALTGEASLATVKRTITELINSFYISVEGKARATKYFVSPLFAPIDLDDYYSKGADRLQFRFNTQCSESFAPFHRTGNGNTQYATKSICPEHCLTHR